MHEANWCLDSKVNFEMLLLFHVSSTTLSPSTLDTTLSFSFTLPHSRITHAVSMVTVSLQLHQYRPPFRSTIGSCKFCGLLNTQAILKDQSWDLFGRNDSKAETPVLWPSHAKSWLIGKRSDAGRDWGQEEQGTTEDEMAGWHHWLDGRESEWTPGDGDEQGGLACCDS